MSSHSLSRRTSGSPRKGKQTGLKLRLKKKGKDKFQMLKKLFLGAIEKLPEESVRQALVDSESLIKGKYLDLNQPIKKDTHATFLHTAAWFRKVTVVEFLLQHQANPNAVTDKGNSPLHLACENADSPQARQIIEMLVAYGGNIHLANEQNHTPLDKAAAMNEEEFVLKVAAKYEAQQAMGEGEGQLADLERHLLAEEMGGGTPMSRSAALAVSVTAPVNDLAGAAPEKKNLTNPKKIKKAKKAVEELNEAFAQGDDAAVESLLKEHAKLIKRGYLDLDQPTDGQKRTFLHKAVWDQKPRLVALLLKFKANPNVETTKADTPLHLAVEKPDSPTAPEIVELLLEHGANADAKNCFNQSPLEMSQRGRLKAVFERIMQQRKAQQATAMGAAGSAGEDGSLTGRIKQVLDAQTAEGRQLMNRLNAARGSQEDEFQARLRKRNRRMSRMDNRKSDMLNAAIAQGQQLQATMGNVRDSQETEFQRRLAMRKQKRAQTTSKSIEDRNQARLDTLGQEVAAQEAALSRAQDSAEAAFRARLAQKQNRRKSAMMVKQQMRGTDGAIVQELLDVLKADEMQIDGARARTREQAEAAMAARMAERMAKKKAAQQAASAAHLEEEMRVNRIFSLLDTTYTERLSPKQIAAYYLELTGKQVSVDFVREVVGTATPQNFFRVIHTLHMAAYREDMLRWDYRCFNSRGLPSVDSNGVAKFVYTCNASSDRKKYKKFVSGLRKQKNLDKDEPMGVTFEELRDALIPTMSS